MQKNNNEKRIGIALMLMGLLFAIPGMIFIFLGIWYMIFILLVGAIIFAAGIKCFCNAKKEQQKAESLRQHGVPIEAVLVSSKKMGNNRKLSFYYQVTCEWEDPKDGQKHLFEQTIPIWIDPQKIMEQFGISTLKIIVNPNNYQEFEIDTKILEEKIRDLTNL